MQYDLTFDSFLEIPFTSGTIQNISDFALVEISTTEDAESGLILYPWEKYQWNELTIYARSAWGSGETAHIAVEPLVAGSGGGGGGGSYILPVATGTRLGGVKSSDEAGAIKVDSDGKMTYNVPTSTPLSAPDWETNTAYPENALVEYNNNIYICLTAHTSGTFADDLANGKWKLVSMTLTAATSSELGGVKSNSADGGVTVDSDGKMTINLPTATSSTLGGVKSSTTDGKVKVESDGTMTMNLPTASASTLGGIKIGTGVEVDANGKLNVTAGTASVIGGVKSSTSDGKVKIESDGTMTMNLPTATASVLGGVKSSALPGKISVDSTTGVMTYNPPNTELAVGEVGYVSWQYSLITNHLPLDGSTINDFGTDYPELLAFFTDNNLVTSLQADYDANKALLLYDSGTDVATMPNFLDKTLWGGSTIAEKSAGLPNIKGSLTDIGTISTSGSFYDAYRSTVHTAVGGGSGTYGTINFDASRSSSIYSDSVTTVQPPAIQLLPQIRYQRDVIINDGTPIGTVISFFGLTAPTGYLSCDGTVYNIADYSALADHINTQFGSYNFFGGDGIDTFAVPDLRGEFLRGTGTNSHTNQGSGTTVGTHQDGTQHATLLAANTNYVYAYKENATANTLLTKADSAIKATGAQVTITGNNSTFSTHTPSVFTSRPTNTSVLYCIKF